MVKTQAGETVTLVRNLFERSVREFVRDESPQVAAAISYYVLFSLFPLLIFAVGIVGVVLRDSALQKEIIDFALENIPLNEGEGRNAVTDAVQGIAGASSGGLGLLGLLGMGWSASNMFGVIRRALNKTYQVERKRPFVQQKLVDLAMVGGLGLFFLASIAATAALRIIRDRSQQMAYIGDVAEAAGILWDLASYLLPLVLSFIAFTVVYTVVPAQRRRLRDVWPGALFAAAVFELGKISFSFYLENFSNYDVVFGSLGAVAAFLFWVYISANIMLFGAQMVEARRRLRTRKYQKQPPAGAKRPLKEKVWRAVKGLFVHVPPEEKHEAPPREAQEAGARARRR